MLLEKFIVLHILMWDKQTGNISVTIYRNVALVAWRLHLITTKKRSERKKGRKNKNQRFREFDENLARYFGCEGPPGNVNTTTIEYTEGDLVKNNFALRCPHSCTDSYLQMYISLLDWDNWPQFKE